MKRVQVVVSVIVLLLGSQIAQTQQTVATNTNVAVPPLVNFSGTLTDGNGRPLTGNVAVTFSLYSEQTGGAALWMETQNVQPDRTGHYTAMLGSTSSSGLPSEIFAAGEAHWLGVQVEGEAEQPRVLLVSAPYALKAGDAQTLGGLPASAFVLAAPASGSAAPTESAGAATVSAAAVSSDTSSDVTTTGGTVDAIPLFSTATNIQNSLLTQTGTSAINVAGKLILPATGAATSSAGANSRPLDFVVSSYDTSTSAAVAETFQWQAQAAGNDTSSPSATLNLLFGSGTTAPAQTGLHIASTGLIAFAKGQTFPGTGTGTITGVTAGTDLTGGGTSGSVTLNLDTTKVPLLNAANTFTGSQAITGGLTITQTASGVGLFVSAPNGYYGFEATGDAVGVLGSALATGGDGVIGSATGGKGVYGIDNATSGASIGVYGQSNSSSGNGVVGQGSSGVVGTSTICCGVGGAFTGWTAPSGSGDGGTEGVKATGGGADPAGNSYGGDGVDAYGGNADFSGTTDGGGAGVTGFGGGGGGVNTGFGSGSDGSGGAFIGSDHTFGGDGVDGYAGSGYAGWFYGDVDTTGQYLTNGSAVTEIDHPLDPANKYLVHASVGSSEMMNIYSGNVITDVQGDAIVQLPDWFEVLNTDFRYQLTVIGQFAQAIISHKIENHQFQIRTNAPNVEVSWQVTGVRQDAYAKAHPLVVEEEKDARLRGYYTHPELYGAPPEKQIEWARHPQMMKKIQQTRQAQLQHRAAQTAPAATPAASVTRPAPLQR